MDKNRELPGEICREANNCAGTWPGNKYKHNDQLILRNATPMKITKLKPKLSQLPKSENDIIITN